MNATPWLTIFTPTYNRESLLTRLYESIAVQADCSIVWMVIDDGSTDHTQDVIQALKLKARFPIQYIYQENGGMHTAHNTAYENIQTPLCMCIDSDDFLAAGALKSIYQAWKSIEYQSDIAGVVGLDAHYDTRKMVGSLFPKHMDQGKLLDLYENHGVKGDKKIVLKTEYVRKVALFPVYEGEKLVPLSALYTSLNHDYDFKFYNEVWCWVDYQIEGMSQNVFKSYQKNPQGYGYLRVMNIKYSPNINFSVKNYLHLISCVIFAPKLFKSVRKNNLLLGFFLLFPIGLLLNLWIRIQNKFKEIVER